VCQWFASRADLILLLFDPFKLDISDEFREVITAMRGHEVRACGWSGGRERCRRAVAQCLK